MDSELAKKPIEELNVVEGTNIIQEWMDKAVDGGLEGVTNQFALWLRDAFKKKNFIWREKFLTCFTPSPPYKSRE